MKVVITNTVVLNGGDAAILLALIKMLRQAFGEDTDIVVFDTNPEAARRYYPNIRFRRQNGLHPKYVSSSKVPFIKTILTFFYKVVNRGMFLKTLIAHRLLSVWHFDAAQFLLTHEERDNLDEYRSADIIVSTGGTYLVEHYDLSCRILDLRFASTLNKPVILFTQSLGPFYKTQNIRSLLPVFESAALILLRDSRSASHLKDIGVDHNRIRMIPDSAFSLADQFHLDNSLSRKYNSCNGLNIAISVRDWRHFQSISADTGMLSFKRAISDAVHYLVQNFGARIQFISTCQGTPEYYFDDAQVATDIVSSLDPDVRGNVSVNSEHHHPEDLIQKLSQFDLVVATRMHMAIMSLAAGTPVLPISYEFKTDELFTQLGLQQWIQNIERIDGHSLGRAIINYMMFLSTEWPSIANRVKTVVHTTNNTPELLKKATETFTINGYYANSLRLRQSSKPRKLDAVE